MIRQLILIFLCLVPGILPAVPGQTRSCRILFLQGPDNAPETLHLFDGAKSRVVDLPRMNFSEIYKLPSGPLTLWMLAEPLVNPDLFPKGAPSVKIAEEVMDFYLIVSSDPANGVAPVRMNVISANADLLKPGQTLWLNMTKCTVGGRMGSRQLAIGPESRVTLDAPATGAADYAVNLAFRLPGKDTLYPLCETRWRHDPRSRGIAFIVAEQGVRSPRILVFPDYREAKLREP